MLWQRNEALCNFSISFLCHSWPHLLSWCTICSYWQWCRQWNLQVVSWRKTLCFVWRCSICEATAGEIPIPGKFFPSQKLLVSGIPTLTDYISSNLELCHPRGGLSYHSIFFRKYFLNKSVLGDVNLWEKGAHTLPKEISFPKNILGASRNNPCFWSATRRTFLIHFLL